MGIKTFSTVSLLFFLTIGLYAQNSQSTNTQIKWGKEVKEPGRTDLTDIIAYDNNGFFTVREHYSKNKTSIEFYDQSLNKKKSYPLEEKGEYGKRYYLFGFQLKNNLYLFSSEIDKKEDKNLLMMETLEKKSMTPRGEAKQLNAIDYSEAKNKYKGYFAHKISPDSTKVLIYSKLPFMKKNYEKFKILIYDADMNASWQRTITMPYLDELFVTKEFRIDNDGNVYILCAL